jgi:hypothetical protein
MVYMKLGLNTNKVVLAVLVQNNVSDNSHITLLPKNHMVQHTTCKLYVDSGSVYIRNIPTHLPEYTTSHPRRKLLLRFENLTT